MRSIALAILAMPLLTAAFCAVAAAGDPPAPLPLGEAATFAVDDPLSRDANQPPEPPKQAAPNSPQGKENDAASAQDNGGKAKDKDTEEKKDEEKKDEGETAAAKCWNFHAQTTVVLQGDSGFPAQYSGPNSLNPAGERQQTLSADLFAGLRLWHGAELHADLLMWQGFGLSQTFGIEAFPNGDAYKAGTETADVMGARLFIRQTYGLGGEQEDVPDGPFTLAGKQDISRLTFTVGRFTPTDICDRNAYANDPHTQFLNWATNINLAWDYASDEVGYTTGLAVELNQPDWALRYGFFQMPSVQNGFTAEDQFLCWPGAGADGPFFKSWGMMVELERRYKVDDHPGAIRYLAFLNQANMASYAIAAAMLQQNPPGPNVPQGTGADVPPGSMAYRYKYGFGLNWEQELAKNVGVFSRLGWNDGHEEAWTYSDANWTASLGFSVKGERWHRPDDTIGLAGIFSGASRAQQEFLEAGGLGILNGDGALSYDCEKVMETYYAVPIGKTGQFMLDYQLVCDPAFNSARGPVSIFGARLHFDF
jgi:high affinity Mn2+ porin